MRVRQRLALVLLTLLLGWGGAVCHADGVDHKLVIQLAVESPGTAVIVSINGKAVPGVRRPFQQAAPIRNVLKLTVPESASEVHSIEIRPQAGPAYSPMDYGGTVARLYLYSITLDNETLVSPSYLPGDPVSNFSIQIPSQDSSPATPAEDKSPPPPAQAPPIITTHRDDSQAPAWQQSIARQLEMQSQALSRQGRNLLILDGLMVLVIFAEVGTLTLAWVYLVRIRKTRELPEISDKLPAAVESLVGPQIENLLEGIGTLEKNLRGVSADLQRVSGKPYGASPTTIAAEAFARQATETMERLDSQIERLEQAAQSVARKEPDPTVSNLIRRGGGFETQTPGGSVSRSSSGNVIRPEASADETPAFRLPRHTAVSESTSRLKEVLEGYAQAVRDPQDAVAFFSGHALQTLTVCSDVRPASGGAALKRQPQEPLNAQFWGLEAQPGRWLIFPGFSLYSQRGALAAGGWHAAKERFTGLYELVPGRGFLKRPALCLDSGGQLVCEERGRLELSDY